MPSGHGAAATFHFSPRPNRAHEIHWQEWGPEAFAEAQRQDRPILLAISAVWCHWCHVMDETSYSDPRVISLINERFAAIRVDNDQRPDINARYNMGGWPTTAFLTPDGELLAGMTYVSADQMASVLEQVSAHYNTNREEIEAKIAEMRESRRRAAARSTSGELSDRISAQVLAAIGDAYDPAYGGFGTQPKFPHSDAIDLLLHASQRRDDRDLLHMARKTLERMADGGIFDQEWGSFFRYSTTRDWSVPHFEKMLEDNSSLLHNLLLLYRIAGAPEHRRVAERIIAYLDAWLSDPTTGAFYGSQDADEDFYSLDAAEREKRPAPYVDPTVYTSWNAMAASAYLEASWTLDRPELAVRAMRALDFLWEACHRESLGMHRFHDGSSPRVPGLLADQAFAARAFLEAFEVTAEPVYLQRAEELARLLRERFSDEAGAGFFDTWDGHESLGRLESRQKPLVENAVCAEVFTRLARLTGEPDHQEMARRTLAAFVGVEEAMGYFAAAYARAVDSFLNPGADVRIVGAAADGDVRALHRAALALPVADRTVQVLDPARDGERLARLALPAEPASVAYVCLETICSAPVQEPAELSAAVEALGREPRKEA